MSSYDSDHHIASGRSGLRVLFSDKLALLLLCAVGLLLRLDYLIASKFIIDSDEAIVGLMAKHIVEGHAWPVFYYGQNYMGSLEALLVALSYKLFGISNFSLKLVPLLFSILLIPITYLLGFALAGRSVARVSALFMAIPPSALVLWSSKARGGFVEVIFIGLLALYFSLFWLRQDKLKVKSVVVVFALLGLGWWVNNQIIYFILPIGVLFLSRFLAEFKRQGLWNSVTHSLAAIFSFFIGGLPFWIHNFKSGFASFDMFGRAETGNVLQHLKGLLSSAFPILLGARRFWHEQDLFPAASILVCFVYSFILICYILLRRRALLDLFKLRFDKVSPFEIVFLVLGATISVFALSSFGYLVKAPRYLLPLFSAIFLLSAFVLVEVYRSHRLLAVSFTTLILLINLCSSYWGGRALAGQPIVFAGERVSKDHSQLIDWLAKEDYDFVRTNYWIGYRLAFESKEEVKFSIFQTPRQVRIESYEEAASRLDRNSLPFVLVPAQAKLVERALQVQGFEYRRHELSDYVVIDRLKPVSAGLLALSSDGFKVETDYKQDTANKALDGNLSTRWGSAHPQIPEMKFEVDLGQTQTVRSLRYALGDFVHDIPRALSVEAVLTDGSVKRLCDQESFRAIVYLMDRDTEFAFYFSPIQANKIVLTQLGAHSIFDWSIAELSLYG